MIDFSNFNQIDDQLRDYQNENKQKIYNEWQMGHRIMLQMPTGTGKTRLFVSIVKDLQQWSINNKKALRTLILAHRQELIAQISENVGFRYGIAHGIIMSSYEEKPKLPTQVASVQTLSRRLEKWKDKDFDIIIIDEAHHTKASTYLNIIQTFKNARILGVTATPYRMNGEGFRPVFDKLIISPSVSEFIDMGYLSNYEYYSIKPDSELYRQIEEINEFSVNGDFAESALTRIIDKPKIRAKIVDTYLRYAKGKKGIVYTIDISHNKSVCDSFNKNNLKAISIDSNTSKEEREKFIRDFKNGKIDIICNVNIFSEGFDCPDVEFIQLARPTKSLSMYLQQVGRGFRTHLNKEKLIVLDNVGLYNRFGLPSAKRKWEYHFNGHYSENDYKISENLFSEEVKYIEEANEIEEGNEAVGLLYASTQNEFDEIINYQIFTETIFGNGLIENYKKIRKDLKWGIFNENTKKLVLPVIYDEIEQPDVFQHAKVKKDQSWGIIDRRNWNQLISTEYSEIERIFDTHYFIVRKNEKEGIIDSSNQIMLAIEFEEILPVKNANSFHINGFKDNKWEVYEDDFTVLEDYRSLAKPFYNEFYVINIQCIYSICRKDYKLITPCIFKQVIYAEIPNPLLIVQTNDNLWGILDNELNWVVGAYLNSISQFSFGLLKITEGNKSGIIKMDGTNILPIKYHKFQIHSLHEFIIGFDISENLWHITDINGHLIIQNKKKIAAINEFNLRFGIKRKTLKNDNANEQKLNSISSVSSQKSIHSATSQKKLKDFLDKLKFNPKIQKQNAILILTLMELIELRKITSEKVRLKQLDFNEFRRIYFEYIGTSENFEFDFITSIISLVDNKLFHLSQINPYLKIKLDCHNPESISEFINNVNYILISEDDFKFYKYNHIEIKNELLRLYFIKAFKLQPFNKNTIENIVKNEIKKNTSGNDISGVGNSRAENFIETVTRYLAGSKSPSSKTQTANSTKEEETDRLKLFADNKNRWIDKVDEQRYLDEGVEQKVYLSEDGKHVIKFNNGVYYQTWADYLQALTLHNSLFNATPYELIGFRKDGEQIQLVVKQPYVVSAEQYDFEVIKKFLEYNGFVHKRNKDFINIEKGIILEDLHDENVLFNGGIFFVIDSAVYQIKTNT